jgi:hypothetical protein
MAVPKFEVSGVVTTTEDDLHVRVDLKNTGDLPARPLTVSGELFGGKQQARIETGLGPGENGSVTLVFPLAAPRAGVHALPLLLEFPEGGATDAAGNPPLGSQRAYLLLALGETAEPAVRVEATRIQIEARGGLEVALTSLDREPHRVRLTVYTARGIRVDGPPVEVEVPAQGRVTPVVTLARSGAPRGTRHGILLVAETLDGRLERTSVATSVVEVLPDPGLLPRLRLPLVIFAVLLLAASAALEVRRHRAPAPVPGP